MAYSISFRHYSDQLIDQVRAAARAEGWTGTKGDIFFLKARYKSLVDQMSELTNELRIIDDLIEKGNE